MSDGVKTESEVPTKRYPEAVESPGKVGGGPAGDQNPQELVGTPTSPDGSSGPASIPASLPAASPAATSKTETAVLPAPTMKAKASCPKCQGRGFIGTMDTQGPGGTEKIKVPCKCVKLRR